MPDAGRFSEVGEQGSRAVVEAAAVLEHELAAGRTDATTADDRLSGEPRLDPEEFGRLVQQVSEHTHQLIDAVGARLAGNTAAAAAAHTRRLTANAHDALDLLLKLTALTTEFPERANGRAAEPQQEHGPQPRPGQHPGGAEGHRG
ncbi:hypothetical protein ACFVHB_04565 [Kitasatospora sp. NPDC127111]|uniref:hypothetical protein n=1 Tax=Kitasatospora sp. NPDC127111 TaxID=3345363 RepID=UPI00362B5A42